MPRETSRQDQLYEEANARFAGALARLAHGYEANPEICRDLVQDIHVALWRSLANFDGRCGLRTWVYRVAHNTATSHILKERRQRQGWATLEDIHVSEAPSAETALAEQQALNQLLSLIQTLHPSDRQIILLYLEGMEAAAIADITGLKPPHIATKIYRIKALLSRQYQENRHD